MATIDQHFTGRAPALRATCARIVSAAKRLGAISDDPNKTAIHLVRRAAIAGVATRTDALILTLESDRDIRSRRIVRHERASVNRWHLDVRLKDPAPVDGEIESRLKCAFDLSE
jgi:uncharacterized protein DUF5655